MKNGILQVGAEDKGTGKAEKITITADKGRLSEEEIERMVREAEEFAEEDAMMKERVDAKNGLESYCYQIKNMLEDEEAGVADKLSEDDIEKLNDKVDDTLDWLDEHPDADTEDFEDKKSELEKVAHPIMKDFYAGAGGAPPGGAGGFGDEEDEDYDFGDDEL